MTNRKSRLLDKLIGSPVQKNALMLQLFMCMYFKISDTEHTIKTMGGPVTVRPGSVLISITKFSTMLGISRPTIDKYLATFRELGLLIFGEMGRAGTLVTFNLSTGTNGNDGGGCEAGRASCDVKLHTDTTGNVGVPTASVDTGSVRLHTQVANDGSFASSLTSYEVRKDNITHIREGEGSEVALTGMVNQAEGSMKAACEGENKVAQVQGPLLCTASPTQPSVQGAPVSSGVVPDSSPITPPSPASPKLGVAQRLKLEKQQEREREAQETAGTVVSEGRDRACAAGSQRKVAISVPPKGSLLTTMPAKKRISKAQFPPGTIENKIAQQLIDLILSEMPDNKTANNAYATSWAHTIHAMIEVDSRDPDEMSAILDFIASCSRWDIRTILRVDKFMDQYDRLAVKYRTRKGAAKSRTQSDKATPQAVVTQREDSMARLARLQTEHAEKCGGVIAPNLGAEFGF